MEKVINLCTHPSPAPTPKHELEQQRDWWLGMVMREPDNPLVDHWASYAAVLQCYINRL